MKASDRAFEILQADRWSVGESAYHDPDSGRLVWLVYCHRDQQQIVAEAETQDDAWIDAVRMAEATEAPA